MSNRNDPESAAAMAVFAGIALIGVFLLFVGAIISLVLTFICIWAWNEEREVFGQTFTPAAARGFIAWGIVGAIVVGLFSQVMYHNGVLLERNLSWMPHLGYVIFSLSWVAYYAENEDDIEAAAYEREMRKNGGSLIERIRAQRLAEHEAALPPAEPKPEFQFADFDDEEPRR